MHMQRALDLVWHMCVHVLCFAVGYFKMQTQSRVWSFSTHRRLVIKFSQPHTHTRSKDGACTLITTVLWAACCLGIIAIGFPDNHTPAFHIHVRQVNEFVNPWMDLCGIVMMFSLADFFQFY
jgi:hypothetical protein